MNNKLILTTDESVYMFGFAIVDQSWTDLRSYVNKNLLLNDHSKYSSRLTSVRWKMDPIDIFQPCTWFEMLSWAQTLITVSLTCRVNIMVKALAS